MGRYRMGVIGLLMLVSACATTTKPHSHWWKLNPSTASQRPTGAVQVFADAPPWKYQEIGLIQTMMFASQAVAPGVIDSDLSRKTQQVAQQLGADAVIMVKNYTTTECWIADAYSYSSRGGSVGVQPTSSPYHWQEAVAVRRLQ